MKQKKQTLVVKVMVASFFHQHIMVETLYWDRLILTLLSERDISLSELKNLFQPITYTKQKQHLTKAWTR